MGQNSRRNVGMVLLSLPESHGKKLTIELHVPDPRTQQDKPGVTSIVERVVRTIHEMLRVARLESPKDRSNEMFAQHLADVVTEYNARSHSRNDAVPRDVYQGKAKPVMAENSEVQKLVHPCSPPGQELREEKRNTKVEFRVDGCGWSKGVEVRCTGRRDSSASEPVILPLTSARSTLHVAAVRLVLNFEHRITRQILHTRREMALQVRALCRFSIGLTTAFSPHQADLSGVFLGFKRFPTKSTLLCENQEQRKGPRRFFCKIVIRT